MADLERAKVLVELRRLAEAREQLAAVLAAEPDNAEAATYLAQAAYLDQRYREAAEQSAAALRIQPRNQFAMRIHALALLNTGDSGRRQAQQVARQVVALGPEFAENHRIMAIVLRECGDLPAALAAIDRAVELDPDEADIHVARGSILRRMGRCGTRFRPGPAAEAYHTALRLEPESAYAVHDLAIVELNGRRLRSALRGVLKAATMEPGLGDLVRTNVATVVRHALRRMHWVLVAVAFVTLVLGGFRLPPSAVPAGPDIDQTGYGSSEHPAPQLVPVGRGADSAGLPAPEAPSPPGNPASVAAPGTATRGAGPAQQAGSVPGTSSAHAPGSAEPHDPGVPAGPGPSVARASAQAGPQSSANKVGGQGDSPTDSSVPGDLNQLRATADSSSATHDPARLETLARIVGGVGFGLIVVVSVWWLRAVPLRRWRFVLRAAWASPPTALRLAVFSVGLVVCVLGVATGMRVFLSVGEPVLVAVGVILRRIA